MADTGAGGNGGERASTPMEELRTDKQEAKDALKRAEAKETLFLNKLTALESSLTDITKASSGGAGAGGVDNTEEVKAVKAQITAATVTFNKAQDAVTAAQATLNTLNQRLAALEQELREQRQSGGGPSDSLSPLVASMHIAKTLKTAAKQGAASSLVTNSKPVTGFGYLPTSARFDPTPGSRLHDVLVPSKDDIALASEEPWIPVCGEGVQLISAGEKDRVKPQFGDFLARTHGMQAEVSLDKAAILGVASGDLDAAWRSKDGGLRALAEAKGREASVDVAMRQAAIYATTAAMQLLVAGVGVDEVVIPVFAHNGGQVQFGATFLLRPSFPVFVVVSKVLDLADSNDNRIARAYLNRAKRVAHTNTNGDRLVESVTMELATDQYHFKVLDTQTLARGLGLFSPSGSDYERQVSVGLSHMMSVLTVLYEHTEARNVVVFPLAVRSPDTEADGKTIETSYRLVYPDMVQRGYTIGTPRRDDHRLAAYIDAVESSLKLVHDAGVVHLDLYPSNIMWKDTCDGQVDIQFIDWDVSHLVAERFLVPAIEKAHRGGHHREKTELTPAFDRGFVTTLRENHSDELWESLASNDKNDMDAAFFTMLRNSGSSAVV